MKIYVVKIAVRGVSPMVSMDSEAREYCSLTEAIATESMPEVRFHYLFIDGYWKVMYRSPEGWKMKLLALVLRRCQE